MPLPSLNHFKDLGSSSNSSLRLTRPFKINLPLTKKGIVLYLQLFCIFEIVLLFFFKDWSVGSGDISLIHPLHSFLLTFYFVVFGICWQWLPKSIISLEISKCWLSNSISYFNFINYNTSIKKNFFLSTIWLPWNKIYTGKAGKKEIDSVPLFSK